ncbi:MAG TPA: hypothetical protein VGJ84_11100, partial [Polyangiaceae bacterium]
FPRLGIPRAEIAFFEAAGKRDRAVRVLSLARGTVRLDQSPVRPKQLPRLLLPELSTRAIYVSSLKSESEVFGVVVMEIGAPSNFIYDCMRASLSAALGNVRRRGWLLSA